MIDAELDDTRGADSDARVEQALATVRELLTDDELQEHRYMLVFLGRTHAALSSWIEAQRPVPGEGEPSVVVLRRAAGASRSGMREKPPEPMPALDEPRASWVDDHRWLVRAVARELSWLAPRAIRGDVPRPAYEGLVKAAARFDSSRGTLSTALAYRAIVSGVFDAVDRKYTGSAKRYRAAFEAIENTAEIAVPASASPAEQALAAPLTRAAAAMCLSTISQRWSVGQASGRGTALEQEVSEMADEDQVLFLGHTFESFTWEMLATEAGTTVPSVKRRVASIRAELIARLRARGVRGSDG